MSRLTSREWAGPPSLRYVELPNPGPPLLLLHGLARWWWDYSAFFRGGAGQWHFVFLDHPGHGRSARTPGAYLATDYVRHAAGFLLEHFTEPVVIYGHSLGAMVALGLAAECPGHVAGVVLEDPPFHSMGTRIGETQFRAQFEGMREVARRGGRFDQMVDALAAVRLPDGVCLGDVRSRDALLFSASCLRHVDPEIFTPVIAGKWLDGYDHAALARQVTCPLLLLQGDAACGGALTEDDAALFPRREFFSGIGHQIHSQQPDRVLALLYDFHRELFD
jgi:pimeloyl-ACP methyl ester carboxylesterase